MRVGQLEFLKVNAEKQEWRDVYHWILSLSWPRFALLILGVYLAINLIFAALYAMGGPCIAGMVPGSFISAFFFSAETLATVGVRERAAHLSSKSDLLLKDERRCRS